MKRFAMFAALFALGPACASRPAVLPRHPAPLAPSLELVLHLPTGLESPTATITFGGATQQASVGTYCWTRPTGPDTSVSTCADTTGENVLVDSYVTVPAGTLIKVDGTPRDISGRLGTATDLGNHQFDFELVQKLALSDGEDVLRAEAGDYTLDVFASWDRGDAGLAFGVRIVAS